VLGPASALVGEGLLGGRGGGGNGEKRSTMRMGMVLPVGRVLGLVVAAGSGVLEGVGATVSLAEAGSACSSSLATAFDGSSDRIDWRSALGMQTEKGGR
jgi:hypothetical protein